MANCAYDDNDAFSVRLRIDDSLSFENIQPGYEILAQKVRKARTCFFYAELRRSIWFHRSGDPETNHSAFSTFDDGQVEEPEKGGNPPLVVFPLIRHGEVSGHSPGAGAIRLFFEENQ